jgi:tyrosine-protein kinase Etk/Wzc
MTIHTHPSRINVGTDDPTVAPTTLQLAEDDEVSLLDLLITIAERKRLICLFVLVFAILAAIISLLLPKRYIATATLLPPQQSTSMGAALVSQLGSVGGMAALAGGSLGLKNPNDMYVAMLKSRVVEDAMVQRFGLMHEYHARFESDACKMLEAHATIDGSGKDGLINITVEDINPQRSAELANGYVDEFRQLSQHLAISEASQRRLFFQQELEQAKNNLANAEEALKETELTTGIIEPDSQARALIESAATLRAQITAREVQIQGMQTYATGNNSQLVEAESELASMRAQLAKLGGSEDNKSGEFIVPKGRVPETGLEYVRKLRDVKYYETIFDILARQFEVAKLDEAKQGAVIQVLSPAIAPDRRSFPKRSLITLSGALAGGFLGLVFIFLQAGFRRLKENPDTGLKVTHLRNALWAQQNGSDDQRA